MKQVKLFYDTSDTAVNAWIAEMTQKAIEATAGNVGFIVHDIKISATERGEELCSVVAVIYEHTA